MNMKVKDYYDIEYSYMLAEKLTSVYPDFNTKLFISLLQEELEQLEFNDRQELLAKSLHETLQLEYADVIAIFTKILGPELEGSLGMFTQGYWLWPLGRYVELYGDVDFEVSTQFSKELTKRFTSEYCMRPIILKYPERSMKLLIEWSKDENKRVRRLASECIRIRLPWAKKMYVALDYYDMYVELLTNLKDDLDKTTQKSVANNLNDLFREVPDKFEEIVNAWSIEPVSKECQWVIKHGSRTKRKKLEAEL